MKLFEFWKSVHSNCSKAYWGFIWKIRLPLPHFIHISYADLILNAVYTALCHILRKAFYDFTKCLFQIMALKMATFQQRLCQLAGFANASHFFCTLLLNISFCQSILMYIIFLKWVVFFIFNIPNKLPNTSYLSEYVVGNNIEHGFRMRRIWSFHKDWEKLILL